MSGGALQFLTSGSTPGTNSQESETASSLPSWYTDYTQNILKQAQAWGDAGYQAYGGPRIAGQDALSTNAEGASAGLPGAIGSNYQNSSALINSGANSSDPLGTANPYFQKADAGLASSIAPGSGGLAAAQPYLNSASAPSYSNIQNYLNPYNTNVTDAIARAGNTNFQNYTMPALSSSIIGAGNITGSSTEGANLMENAAQQNNANITNAQAGALQQGYASSMSAAQADAAREASLAGTAGTLGTQQQTAEQNAATDLINQGVAAGNLNTQGANTRITAGGALSSVGANDANSYMNSLNMENQFGLQNQGNEQANLNLAYQDFQNQNNFPLTAAAAEQGALGGIQVPTMQQSFTAGQGTPATTGPAPLVTAMGALGTYGAGTQNG